MQRRPIDINRAAWFLIRRYGDDCAKVAFQRAQCCACRQDNVSADEWELITRKVVELYFSCPCSHKLQ